MNLLLALLLAAPAAAADKPKDPPNPYPGVLDDRLPSPMFDTDAGSDDPKIQGEWPGGDGERVDGKRVSDLLKKYQRHRFAPVLRDIKKYAGMRDREKDAKVKSLYAMIAEGSRAAAAAAMRFEKAKRDKDKKAGKEQRAALESALGRVFDAKLALHDMQVRELEERLKKLKAEVAFRSSKKSRIVERKVEELTEKDGAWDW